MEENSGLQDRPKGTNKIFLQRDVFKRQGGLNCQGRGSEQCFSTEAEEERRLKRRGAHRKERVWRVPREGAPRGAHHCSL